MSDFTQESEEALELLLEEDFELELKIKKEKDKEDKEIKK